MRFLTSILFAVIAVAAPESTHAFTQGFTLLPSYLCGPAVPNVTSGVLIGADKLPKALGGVLNLFQLQTPAHFEGNVYDANVDPRYWVGAYHNVVAQTKAIQFYGQGPNKLTDPAALAALKNMPDVIPIIPQVYVIGVNKIAATPINQDPQNAFLPNVITPNELVTLSVFVQNNDIFPVTGLPGPTQKANNKYVPNSDVALDGAIIYAQTPANQRVGKFVVPVVAADAKVPSTFSVWPACGADGAGIVHNQVLSDTNIVNGGAQFFLPWNFLMKNPQVKQITFMGAAVTDNGFGYHQTTWTVQAAASFTLQGTIANAATALPKCTSKANFPAQQPCFAACLQCLQLANGAANVVPMCTPDLAIGDPAKGQQTVFTSGCMVNGVAQKVVPAATPLVLGNLQLKTAAADTTEVAGAAQLMDQIKAAMDNNGTDTTSSSTPACQSGNVNSASTISSVSATTLLTALTVTFGTLFATRQ